MPFLRAAVLFAALAWAAAAPAQEALAARPAPQGGILSLLPAPAVTAHTLALPEGPLRYKATAGTLSLLGGKGEVTAEIFFTYYARDPAANAPGEAPRPIAFLFNGGPGAASAYLHLGGLGPRVLATASDGAFLPPPQRIKDNPDTWLAFTDLVFVDPVGTGYSREAPGQKAEDFWGVERDASAMGAFIRLFLQKSGRTGSPLMLAGESYGGFRAALLARTLQEDVGLQPSAVVMISPALEFSLLRADDLDPRKWALELPSMAAVKLEREGVPAESLPEILREVERFAMTDYLVALAGGRNASAALSDRIASFTGLPADFVRRYAARVPPEVFIAELGRRGAEALSLYDGTIGGPSTEPEDTWRGPDPVLDRSVPTLTAAFVDYVRTELNFQTDISYRLLNGDIARRWDYGTSPSRQGYTGVLEDLQKARALNPSLAVLVAHGYTDLVTPYLASRYLLSQLSDLPTAVPIRSDVYPGGHMFYLRPRSRAALARDAAALLVPTAPPRSTGTSPGQP